MLTVFILGLLLYFVDHIIISFLLHGKFSIFLPLLANQAIVSNQGLILGFASNYNIISIIIITVFLFIISFIIYTLINRDKKFIILGLKCAMIGAFNGIIHRIICQGVHDYLAILGLYFNIGDILIIIGILVILLTDYLKLVINYCFLK